MPRYHLFLSRSGSHQFIFFMHHSWLISYPPLWEKRYYHSPCLVSSEPVYIEEILVCLPLQFPNFIYLMLVTSLLLTPCHALCYLRTMASNNSHKSFHCASLTISTNGSLTYRMQENANDQLFSGHIQFTVQNCMA